PSSTGRSGVSIPTTRWLRPITPRRVRNSPRRWAWDASAKRRVDPAALRLPAPTQRPAPSAESGLCRSFLASASSLQNRLSSPLSHAFAAATRGWRAAALLAGGLRAAQPLQRLLQRNVPVEVVAPVPACALETLPLDEADQSADHAFSVFA